MARWTRRYRFRNQTRAQPDPERYRIEREKYLVASSRPELLSAFIRSRLLTDLCLFLWRTGDSGPAVHWTGLKIPGLRISHHTVACCDDTATAPAPAAAVLAEEAPTILAHPDASRGLEQSLIEAMIDWLGGTELQQDRTASRQHTAIMRRFHRTIEQHGDQSLYLPELCAKVGVAERTLRVVLPGTSRNWPQALFTSSPDASFSPSAPRDRSGYGYGDRNRHAVWLLAIWQAGGRIQGALWRSTLRDARSAEPR